MKDVAREVGVSVTTVSRALNDFDDVAEATKSRIREVARELDYHPNVVARSLQTSRTNAVGLQIPPLPHRAYDPFWLEFVGGMAAVCSESRMDLLISTGEGNGAAGDDFKRLVRGRRVDGLVLCDVQRTDPRMTYLQRQHLPFVAFGRTTGPQTYSYLDVDSEAGVSQAVEHLIELGHRRIAYMGLNQRFGFSHFRALGFHQAMARAGLPAEPRYLMEDLDELSATAAAAQLLAQPERPTAIFAAADYLALAVLRVTRSLGIRVPHDLSLTVFDDNALVRQADPPLSAVSQPNRRLGEEATSLLLDRIGHPTLPLVQRLIVPSFIPRGSTAAPPEPAVQAEAS